MFPTLPKTNFNFSATFDLSSANAFNLDQSKNLSFGNELINRGLIQNLNENAMNNSNGE